MPGIVAGQRAHAGAHHAAIGQHHFHATLHHEVIAVRRVAGATFQRRAHDAAPTGIRHIQPQLQPFLLDVVVQIEKAHARLDQHITEVRVDFEDLVHAFQIEHDRARQARRRPTIGEIAAARDRPHRDAILIGDLETGLHLHDAVRCQRCRRHEVVVIDDRIGIAITLQITLDVGVDEFAADGADKRSPGLSESGAIESRR